MGGIAQMARVQGEKASVATRDGEVHGERRAGGHARFGAGVGVRDDGGSMWANGARDGRRLVLLHEDGAVSAPDEFCATARAHTTAVSRGGEQRR